MKRCFTKKGFTLAEVLIVLAVIGVIAALTIPTLMTKWREQATVTQVKKAYSDLSQACELLIAQRGNDAMQQILQGYAYADYGGATTLATAFASNMRNAKQYDTTNIYTNNSLDLNGKLTGMGGANYGISTANGSVLTFWIEDSNCTNNWGPESYGKVCAVVELFTQPEKQSQWGVNVFEFLITADGVVPIGAPGTYRDWLCDINNPPADNSNGPNGSGCAYLVINNGNMDYLHP